ncbi:MAG: hypothetical protein OIN89_01590 [Candidatus Methanoperedens sp.]|jgi:hypothetical protein|nr:hypothetical protein [Candidatus Methanoperedens sp.]PKL54454.1 MAG: hypothetical protein CVV36_01560 [Candidatus Methanoperedenaceae archaeon HGW-Methanoperedenaceae-1]
MVEKTTVRPNVREMKIKDVLHVGTEEKGEIFTVTKLGDNTFIQFQNGELREYGKSVVAKNIYTFAERTNGVQYWITHDED